MLDQRPIDELASRQFGCFSLRQARAAGFDKDAVARRLGNGSWIRLAPTVYSVASAPPKWERQMAAALLSVPRAVVAGRSAAYLHGLSGFGPNRPMILVPHGSNVRSKIAEVTKSMNFGLIRTLRIGAFEVTTVAETLLLVARNLRPERLETVFDDALLRGKVDLDEFGPILTREQGARTRGIRAIRDVVLDRSPSAPTTDSSYLERLLESLLVSMHLPPWVREHPFSIADQPARVDVFLLPWNLVIEADGRSWHMRKDDFERDRRRDNELAAKGIQVLRFTYQMLKGEADACRATILEVGRHRATESRVQSAADSTPLRTFESRPRMDV